MSKTTIPGQLPSAKTSSAHEPEPEPGWFREFRAANDQPAPPSLTAELRDHQARIELQRRSDLDAKVRDADAEASARGVPGV